MTEEKTIQTVAGPFNRKRMETLRQTLADAKKEGRDRAEVINFEGNELLISFGEYLIQFLDMQFANKGHQGL